MGNTQTTVLIIRDGWGSNHNPEEDACNAILQANTPFSDHLSQYYPRTEISASGLSVGLPDGVMGNSEVGHQNIGAGRIVDQEIVRIDKSLNNGTFEENKTFQELIKHVKIHNSKLHLFGLCSDGGVHSVMRHLLSLLKIIKETGLTKVFLHFFSDGRDTPKNNGINYLNIIQKEMQSLGVGAVATVSGRFWAMDRDNRWERIEKAYRCLTGGTGFPQYASAAEAIQNYYDNPAGPTQTGDEFIPPSQILDRNGIFAGKIEPKDGILFFNFRGDRPREITRAFIDPSFKGFQRELIPDLYYATFTEYEEGLCPHIIFHRPSKMKNILGEYISNLGLYQFRCAETEKYAHVTFFFNDYRESPFPREDRVLVPSPKDIETYDQRPQMSAFAVKDNVKEAILSRKYSLIVVNFANPDMVGHTGNFEAGKIAAETVDICLKELLEALDSVDGNAIITADHGNLERMWDTVNEQPFTQHTTNPVELIVYGKQFIGKQLRDGGALCDIAPTLLEMMQLPQPPEMTGKSLLL